MNKFVGFFITFVGAVLFSTKAIIVKKAFADTDIDALTLLTLRMVFSLPFFLVAAYLISNKAGNIKMTRKQWIQLLVLGISGYYLSAYFDFVGLQYISAGLERLILFLYPTFVLIINRVVFKQSISRTQTLALVLTYLGIGIAYFNEMQFDTTNPYFFWGSFLIFLCSVTYAVYIAGSGKVIPFIGANKFAAYSMLIATGVLFVHFIARGDYSGIKQASHMWTYGLLLAIMATVIPTFMLSAGLAKIGSNNVAIISGIGPVSTIVQAHWILGEPIHTAQIAGTVMVIAGVLLTGWKTQSVETKAPAD
ncbi:MAG: DMT family transporter [Chitinophagaceae bacterium]|nr:DMT family transporter [Chitinophagaceae bacterium]